MGTQLYFGEQPVGGSGGEPIPGPKGDDGPQGEKGDDGADSEVPGPKGDPFTYDDFTPEQLEDLKGPAGDPASISTWGELAQKA